MIDILVLNNARKLKKEMDAAYKVFKKTPTFENANLWTAKVREYNDFCVKAIETLISEDDAANKKEEILANVDKYKKCNQCEAELLYLTSEDNYVASSDFVEDFPGWCYPCLVEYCTTHECEGCTVTKRPFNCSFAEIKKLNMPAEQ